MKKFFTPLFWRCLTLMFLTLSFTVNAKTITIVPDAATTGASGTSYNTTEKSFTLSDVSFNINNFIPNNTQIRGNKTTSTNFYLYNTSEIPGNIKTITINTEGTNLLPNKIRLIVGDSSISGDTGGTAGTGSSETNSVSWTVSENCKYFHIAFDKGGTSGTAICSGIVIEYEEEIPVAKPTFSKAEGTYYDDIVTTTISCETQDAAIYYTTDTTDPSATNGTLYTAGEELSFNTTTTLKAIAILGTKVSEIATATYILSSALPPVLTATPTTLDAFATTKGGTQTQTISVGGENLLGNISLTLSGDNADQFSLSTASLTPAEGTVAATDVVVTYNPITVGTHIATLTITSTDATSITYTLTGSVPVPAITATPTTLDAFATTKGGTQTQTISVGGKNLLDNITLTLSGDNADQFSLSTASLTPAEGTVAATDVIVTYNPTTVGSHSATLTITSTDATSITYTLTGSVPVPAITATPTTLGAFATTKGGTQTQTISVGGENLLGNISLTLSGDNADQFSLSTASLTPAEGTVAATDVVVTYNPTTVGSHSATLTITSTDATSITYTLTGSVLLPQLTAPVAIEAENVTPTGFTAKWNAVENAAGYKLKIEEKGYVSSYIFDESFNDMNGEGGDDNQWGGSLNNPNLDNFNGWTFENAYKAHRCIKLGTSSKLGSATTKALGITGDAILWFGAGVWTGDNSTLKISILNGGSLEKETVTLSEGTFNTYAIRITGATPNSQIKIEGYQASKSRFFLDYVQVSTKVIGDTFTEREGSPISVNASANSYDVTISDKNICDYRYSVVAVGDAQNYSDSESSNAILVSTVKQVNNNLGEVYGEETAEGDKMVINLPLTVAYVSGDVAYACTDQGICANPSVAAPGGHDTYEDNEADFDQRDWVALTGIDAQVGTQFAEGLNITVGAISRSASIPYLLTVNKTTATSESVAPSLNSYQVHNILQYSVDGGYQPFWVAPKMNEVANFSGNITETDGVYYLTDNLGKQVAIDNSNSVISAPSEGYVSVKGVYTTTITTPGVQMVLALEAPQIATGTTQVGNDNCMVIAVEGGMEVIAEEGMQVSVFTVAGTLVSNATMGSTSMHVAAEAGLYIVKIGNQVVKVMVK